MILAVQEQGMLPRRCRHRPVQYLNKDAGAEYAEIWGEAIHSNRHLRALSIGLGALCLLPRLAICTSTAQITAYLRANEPACYPDVIGRERITAESAGMTGV